MYVIVWDFLVNEDRQEEFESLYGDDGPWAALFRRAAGYLGTELLACTEQKGRYLTIDRWESAAAFAIFRREFDAQYTELDRRGSGLTTDEHRIGAFEAGTTPPEPGGGSAV
jgi:heme-degrading monooxygenase HmoA